MHFAQRKQDFRLADDSDVMSLFRIFPSNLLNTINMFKWTITNVGPSVFGSQPVFFFHFGQMSFLSFGPKFEMSFITFMTFQIVLKIESDGNTRIFCRCVKCLL